MHCDNWDSRANHVFFILMFTQYIAHYLLKLEGYCEKEGEVMQVK